MKISTDAFRSNETGKLFKGNQRLNNSVRETLFSEACLPGGGGRRREDTIWPRSCVLV